MRQWIPVQFSVAVPVRYIALPVAGAMHFKEAFALQKSSFLSSSCAGERDGAAGLDFAVPVRHLRLVNL